MTEQQTLVRFIGERLAEDEAAARAAGGQAWHQEDPIRWHGRIHDEDGEVVTFDDGRPNEVQAPHIARHDPARVLREVAAKRAIIADHQIKAPYEIERGDEEFGCERCYSDELGVLGFGYCPTLKALAVVYSDHPGYREEWKP